MELIPVRAECVDLIWPKIASLVERACRKGPTHDLDALEVKQLCKDRKHQIWIAVIGDQVSAVAITGIMGTVCEWIAFAAVSNEGWQEHIGTIEQWAKSQGCTSMRSYSRPGMKKHIPEGYRTKGIIYEKALVDG